MTVVLRTADPKVRSFLDAYAALSALPPFVYERQGRKVVATPAEFLEAWVLTESSGDPFASRYEKPLNDTSWGPLQVLGMNLRTLFDSVGTANLSRFQSWEFGIPAGIAFLYFWYNRPQHGPHDLLRALCCYNGGGRGDTKNVDGTYLREDYLLKIAGHVVEVQADRDRSGWRKREGGR